MMVTHSILGGHTIRCHIIIWKGSFSERCETRELREAKWSPDLHTYRTVCINCLQVLSEFLRDLCVNSDGLQHSKSLANTYLCEGDKGWATLMSSA